MNIVNAASICCSDDRIIQTKQLTHYQNLIFMAHIQHFQFGLLIQLLLLLLETNEQHLNTDYRTQYADCIAHNIIIISEKFGKILFQQSH